MDGMAHHRRGKVVETHHVSYFMALRILRGGKKMVLCTGYLVSKIFHAIKLCVK